MPTDHVVRYLLEKILVDMAKVVDLATPIKFQLPVLSCTSVVTGLRASSISAAEG